MSCISDTTQPTHIGKQTVKTLKNELGHQSQPPLEDELTLSAHNTHGD